MTKDFLLDAATFLGGFVAAIQLALWIRDVLFRAGFTARGTLNFLRDAVAFQVLMFSTVGTVLYVAKVSIHLKNVFLTLVSSNEWPRLKKANEWINEWTEGATYFQANQDVFFVCLLVSALFLILAVKSKDPDFYDLAGPLLALDGIILLVFLGVGLVLLPFGINIISITSCINILTIAHFTIFSGLLSAATGNFWEAAASSRR